uniref:Uncharacterized protein n=1 Tax=Anguilla anguilla TaxID=7936 RepID=A0A0E9U5J9_ANGAN
MASFKSPLLKVIFKAPNKATYSGTTISLSKRICT